MGGLGLPRPNSLVASLPFYLCLFRLLYWCPIPLFCVHVLISAFGVQACPIDPYLEWLGVAGKAYRHGHGFVRRSIPYCCVGCFFPGPTRYTRLVPFFGRLMKCRGGGRPRQWPSSAWAVVFRINWAWAGATLSLAPQLSIVLYLYFILYYNSFL